MDGEENPRWIPFKSIDYHSESLGVSPGMLLCAMGFHLESNAGRSAIKSRPRRVPKYLYVMIYAGYDLMPAAEEKDVNAFFEIRCAEKVITLNDKENPNAKEVDHIAYGNKNPTWNFAPKPKRIELRDNLAFEENLKITVFSKSKVLGFISHNIEIGHFTVPLNK
jgi:hypothetical protein